MIKKTLNLFLAGSVLAAAGASFGQTAPGSQRPAAPAETPSREQPAFPPQAESRAQPQADAEDPAELEAKMEEIREDVRGISLKLNEIHQEALLEDHVRQSLVDYETTFNEKVRDSAPGLESQVETHAKVLEEIADIGRDKDELDPREEQEMKGLLDEYNEVKQQLAPLENQLFNDQELMEARMKYQEDLVAAMNDVNSDVEEMIQERMELAQSFMALQQEYLESQQGAQGQAPQSGAPQQAPQPAPGR